jgi:hypothetical protein
MTTGGPASGGPASGGPAPDDPLGRLRRWEASGGHWRVLARTRDRVDLALLSCDAGEEMDRLSSTDPALRGYVGDRWGDRD